jgi:nucleolar pre-ribosomal-associated protein 2
MISQFGIEKLISTFTAITSSSSKALPRPYGSSIYLRLCHTTNTLIDKYRKQLGGRFHVLVPLLQSLLTCLFVPHTRAKLPTSKAPPTWLSFQTGVITAEHGTAYTRILTTLTQPTVTSAAGARVNFLSNKTPDLVDQTRIARQYAAQFVPYILLHFCSMQLVGRLGSEVSQALLPGLWACIDAVPREALRGMSSGMGRDDREIWSALWADWTRINGHVR